MATSGTTTYSLTRDQIIEFALRKIGVLELGTTPDADEVTAAATSLELLVKSWIARGLKVWKVDNLTIPLVDATTSYTIGPSQTVDTHKPLRILQAWTSHTVNFADNAIQTISKDEYNTVNNKTTTGLPNLVFLDVDSLVSTLYVYPTPDASTATNYTVKISVQSAIEDVGISTNNIDFPSEWLYALGWNLAAELAVDYGVDEGRLVYIEQKAQMFKQEAEDFDIEHQSIWFTPSLRRG